MAIPRDPKSELSPRKVAEQLKQEGKERIERGKASAADQVDHVATALHSAGDELGGQSTLGNYANQFAGSIGRLGQRLRDSSVEDLAGDVQATARRNPTMFLLGGVALGFVLARLLKATTSDSEEYQDSEAELEDEGAFSETESPDAVGTSSGAFETPVDSPSSPRFGE